MSGSKVRSTISRIIIGGTSLLSLVSFGAAWVATLVTSGFSVAGNHTFAGWTYFPLFWPHLAAATLGFLLFLRYGGNYATALAVVVLWLVALICDTFGAILYWRLFWLCNITGKDTLTGISREICSEENALLISLMVFATVMWIISIVAAVAHGVDFTQAGRSGKAAPGREITPQLVTIGAVGILCFLVFLGLWIAGFITSSVSIGGSQTYAVWTHANIFSIQVPATVLSLMLFLRYGSNWATALAAIILWAISFFAATYGTVLYWQLGWFCKVSTGSVLSGVDLTICTDEDSYLIALWILVSFLWVFAIIGPISHALDFFDAGKAGSLDLMVGSRRDARSKKHASDNDDDLELSTNGLASGNGLTSPDDMKKGGTRNMDQYGSFDDGSLYAGTKLSIRNGLESIRKTANKHTGRGPNQSSSVGALQMTRNLSPPTRLGIGGRAGSGIIQLPTPTTGLKNTTARPIRIDHQNGFNSTHRNNNNNNNNSILAGHSRLPKRRHRIRDHTMIP